MTTKATKLKKILDLVYWSCSVALAPMEAKNISILRKDVPNICRKIKLYKRVVS